MVIEQPLLQRCQWVDFLHVASTARHRGDNPVNGSLVQVGEREHAWGNLLATRQHPIFRHHRAVELRHAGRQAGQGRLAEQHLYVSLQALLTQALDQLHGQQ